MYSDIAVIQGAVDMSPASAAPMPTVTSRAGRAQHNNVPRDVNSDNEGRITWLLMDGFWSVFMANFFYIEFMHIVSGVCN